jgi:CBS domain-containing protein
MTSRVPACYRWSMTLTVKDLMTTGVVTVRESVTLAEASRLLGERQVSGAPVVNEDGHTVGVISRADLVRGWERAAAARRRAFYQAAAGEPVSLPGENVDAELGGRPVSEVMMPIVFSVQQSDSLRKAAALMSAEGIHRLIVLDGQRIVGLLSASDLVAAIASGKLAEQE